MGFMRVSDVFHVCFLSDRQRKYECKWYLPLTELTFHPPPDAEGEPNRIIL
jgi:hypothetical protein